MYYHPAWNHHAGPAKRVRSVAIPVASGQYLPLDQRGLGDVGELANKVVDAAWSRPARAVASVALLFHGYRRNDSVFWGLVWAALGATSPPFATALALAMRPGFARRKRCSDGRP